MSGTGLDDQLRSLFHRWADQEGEEGARVGCALLHFPSGDRWSLDGNKRFVPASNNKMWTTVAALGELGPHFRWVTRFASDGRRLWIRGGGDPTFDQSTVTAIARSLWKQGVHQVAGPVVLDDSWSEDPPWGRGWMWDDRTQGFAAPVHALNMERNRITFQLDPVEQKPVVRRILPRHSQARVDVRLRWTGTADPEIRIFRTDFNRRYVLEGEVSRDEPEVQAAVESGPEFFAEVFIGALREQGVRVAEDVPVIRGPFAERAPIQLQTESAPLSSLLPSVNRDSDNLVAEILLRTLGIRDRGRLSQEGGERRVRKYFHDRHMQPPTVYVDGSGLSMYNLSTPEALLELLIWTRRSAPQFGLWLDSLARYGRTGTLKDRQPLLSEGVEVAAKTGSLTGVKCLSGYLIAQEEPVVAFSLLINGLLKEQNGEKLQDRFLQLVSSRLRNKPFP